MKSFDPYAELDVARDATEEEVRAAFRKAAKETHPDLGGDVDSFQRAKRAELVLLDPGRRRKYDQTGTVDEEQPDNVRSTALQIIEGFIAGAINEYVQSGFTQNDPRRRTLMEECADEIFAKISNAEVSLITGKKYVLFLKDFRRRFSSTDKASPIERGIDRQIEAAEQTIAKLKESIECHRVAAKIARTYKFEQDPEPERRTGYGFMDSSWGATVG